MQQFKDKWEIRANWQLIFPILGVFGLGFSAYLLSKRITAGVLQPTSELSIYHIAMVVVAAILFAVLLRITLKLFQRLEKKWAVTYRWELIAIFIVFAITGSTAARISDPLLSFLGLDRASTSGWVYWPIRILLIFPIYQILLVFVGWLFGQFQFFWAFEKKMLRRMGLARFLKD